MIERVRKNRIVMKVWRFVRWPLGVVVVLYIGLVIFRIPAVLEKEVTAEAVAAIHAQRLTMADVGGSNLPPAPDPKRVDATVEGIDENENGIRDDVELAIFKKYPNNQKVRAAELQYAKSLQIQLADVFNTETLIASIQNEDRAYFCIRDTGVFKSVSDEANRIEELVVNTSQRKEKYEQIYADYMASYSSPEVIENCDINI